MKNQVAILVFGILSLSQFSTTSKGQIWVEPEIVQVKPSGTPYDLGARSGLGVDLILNDFGFSLGTQYRYLLSPQHETTLSFSIGSLRDVSEQSFTTFYSEIIPNKYKRVISMPLLIGYKQRLLSRYIQDNFRVHLHGAIGPNFAFAYPYFDDFNENGTKDDQFEPVLDALSGWSKGSFTVGTAGEVMIGIDFGNDKKSFSSLRFGIVMHYFTSGIQIMEPFRNVATVVNNIPVSTLVPNAKPQHFFISPQFNLIFGGLW